MKKLLLFVIIITLSFLAAPCAEIAKEKRQEIEKMLRLTGMENLTGQMKTQMVASLKRRLGQSMPEAFWTKLRQKTDSRELIEKVIPVYDKYYTLQDLKAINAFYESPAGRKMMANLPNVVQESMKAGQEWCEKVGREATEEAEQVLKRREAK